MALILHTVALLQKLKFQDYGTLTVLINGDEEISSPGWRSTITRVAGHGKAIYQGLGLPLTVVEKTTGGGRPAMAGRSTRRS